MHLDSCYIVTAYVTHHYQSSSARAKWTSIAVLDVDGFQTCFGSAASAFEIIELAYIHCALKENFSVTLTKKGFTCISLICPELLCALGRTVNTKYKTRQLISFARFTSRTQATGEPKLWLIYKVAPTKQPLSSEANYQRRIYYSIALKGAQVYNGSYK